MIQTESNQKNIADSAESIQFIKNQNNLSGENIVAKVEKTLANGVTEAKQKDKKKTKKVNAKKEPKKSRVKERMDIKKLTND